MRHKQLSTPNHRRVTKNKVGFNPIVDVKIRVHYRVNRINSAQVGLYKDPMLQDWLMHPCSSLHGYE